MSEALGMDKFSFIGKYTEEKTVDGVIFTKLKHKEDLSCALLDIGKSYNFCFYRSNTPHNWHSFASFSSFFCVSATVHYLSIHFILLYFFLIMFFIFFLNFRREGMYNTQITSSPM